MAQAGRSRKGEKYHSKNPTVFVFYCIALNMYTQRKKGTENHHVIETYKFIILHFPILIFSVEAGGTASLVSLVCFATTHLHPLMVPVVLRGKASSPLRWDPWGRCPQVAEILHSAEG